MKNLIRVAFIIVFICAVVSCNKKDCGPQECLNGGVCEKGFCECIDGYSGLYCELDSCANANCQNGATCKNGICECPEGYEGVNCEIVKLPTLIKIVKVVITSFPTNGNLDIPDIYINVLNAGGNDTLRYYGNSSVINNANYAQEHTFILSTPLFCLDYNINPAFRLELMNYNFPGGSLYDNLVSATYFNIYNPSEQLPNFVVTESSTFVAKIYLEYIF